MTKKYIQLTLPQRYQVEALKNAGHSQTAIAKIIDCDKSTISRELKGIRLKEDGVQKYMMHIKHSKKQSGGMQKSRSIFGLLMN